MGNLWRSLSYAHISASAMDGIYQKEAKEEIEEMLAPLQKTMGGPDYMEEAICYVDRYAKKMLEYADIGRATSDQRRFVVAYDVSQAYLSKLMERLDKWHEFFRNSRSSGELGR